MVGNEGDDVVFRAEVNAMAFFKRSCSTCSRSYLRFTSRSAFNSATSPTDTPGSWLKRTAVALNTSL